MAENTEGSEFLTELAKVADDLQKIYRGDSTIIFELDIYEFTTMLDHFKQPSDVKRFKVDISGTEFIYLLKDES
jgi:hypothetical protein